MMNKKHVCTLVLAAMTATLLVGCMATGKSAEGSATPAPDVTTEPTIETVLPKNTDVETQAPEETATVEPIETTAAVEPEVEPNKRFTKEDLIGTWGFAMAVGQDGTNMDPAEYAKANEVPEDMLTAGVLVKTLKFDEKGNVASFVNGEEVDNGTYELNENSVTMVFKAGEPAVGEIADLMLSGEISTTIAVKDSDTNAMLVYGKII